MPIDAFKPEINEQDKFAVALPYSNGDGKIIGVAILKTYPTLDELETAYFAWKKYAKQETNWQRLRWWLHIPLDSNVFLCLERIDPSFRATWMLRGMSETEY